MILISRACQAMGSEGINVDAESVGADGQSHLEPGHCPIASVSPDEGVIIRLAGPASANTNTGRLTASFAENPQFPLSQLTKTTRCGPLKRSKPKSKTKGKKR
jgi:hypothetical protein